jgi:Flp pilus assembly protein TadD
MMLDWFNTREATEIGTALADEFARQPAPAPARGNREAHETGALDQLLRRADSAVRSLRLNFYKKAKFANSFKWRLIENGVASDVADEVTQSLVLHLSQHQAGPKQEHNSAAAPGDRPDPTKAKQLFAQGNKYVARGAYAEAAAIFQNLVELDSRDANALNNLGATLLNLGNYAEAEEYFRQAVRAKPDHPEAHGNLGAILRSKGELAEAEFWLQRAIKLKPNYVDARVNLGLLYITLGRVREAKARFAKVLKAAPRHSDALFGLGQIAKLEGRFQEAEAIFKRLLDSNRRMPGPWAALASIRKMTSADGDWLEGAKQIAASVITPLEEAEIRFAIGKYCDDVDDFEQAFQNYKRANELQKTLAKNYDRKERTRFVDDLIRGHSREALSKVEGGSASMQPVFVVGMMRSGTTLAEQIIASHPAAKGAGELGFWANAMHAHEDEVRRGMLGGPTREKLAEEYLRVLAGHSVDALRIVDKAPVNCDHLGLIHTVFPNARIIYMRRDPIDTCLSCYFQQFLAIQNYTMDLSDLAHYYREHQRLMTHWRTVLPPGSILDVPYAELVADQEAWTRKILDFLGLEWDERCLNFHETKRSVGTASAWQVRQKIYGTSVARWRKYEKFIGPLKSLRE